MPGTWKDKCLKARMAIEIRQPIAVSDISIYICLIDIRSKSKEQLNEKRAGLSTLCYIVTLKPLCSGEMSSSGASLTRDISAGDCRSRKLRHWKFKLFLQQEQLFHLPVPRRLTMWELVRHKTFLQNWTKICNFNSPKIPMSDLFHHFDNDVIYSKKSLHHFSRWH